MLYCILRTLLWPRIPSSLSIKSLIIVSNVFIGYSLESSSTQFAIQRSEKSKKTSPIRFLTKSRVHLDQTEQPGGLIRMDCELMQQEMYWSKHYGSLLFPSKYFLSFIWKVKNTFICASYDELSHRTHAAVLLASEVLGPLEPNSPRTEEIG